MNREIVELREVINKLVPMLTGKGLRVTQRGSQAYVQANPRTNKPEVVNIPSIPDNASSDFISAISGFIDHEVGHVLFTDWKFYGGDGIRVDKFSVEGQALTNSHNIIEDTFVEREIVKAFPGSKTNLTQLHEHFLEKITKKALQQVKGDIKKEFSVLFVPMVRALSGQKIFQDFMDAGDHWSHEMIKNIHMAMSDETLELIKHAKNTEETLKAAQEIHDILFNRKDEPEQKQPEPPSAPKQKGQSQNKPEKKAEAGDGDGKRDHSESEPGDPSETDGDDEGQGGKGSEPDDAGQQTEESDDGDDAGTAGGKESDDADGKKARNSDAESESASDDREEADDDGDGRDGEDSEDDAQDGSAGDDEGEAADDGEDAGSGAAGDDAEEEEAEDGDADEGNAGDEDGEGVSGSVDDDGEDDGEELGEGQAEPEETLEDNQGGGSAEDDSDEQGSGGGFGGDAGKSMFDLDASEFEPVDLSSAIAKEISELATDALSEAEYSVFTRDDDKIQVFDPDAIGLRVRDEWVPRMEETVQGMVGKMQKDIERMMASQSFIVRTPGHTRGRLHSPSLHRVLNNDPRVFTQREELRSKDTAVMLLIDNSGSMHGQEISTAMHAAYALAQTLERVNIPNEVMGFTTSDLSSQSLRDLRKDPNSFKFSRTCAIVMPIFKSFNERVTPTVKRRIASQINAQVGMETNVDGESLEYAAIRLLPRPEKRKVMLVMSDGQPVGNGTRKHLKDTVEKLTQMGIETVGMGINTNAVQSYYPRSMVLNNVADLPNVVMGELRRILQS